MPQITYTIKKNRLDESYISGFTQSGDALYFNDDTGIHRLYIDAIDSATEDAEWGRLSFSLDMNENISLYVYAAAYNYDTWYDDDGNTFDLMSVLRSDTMPDEEKKKIFSGDGAKRFVGKNDILLYGLKGRYLFIAIEALGMGEGSIKRLRIDQKGDNFMDAFPGVYRERDGFFHRFLSVFSSIYNDTAHEIERLPDLLNPDICPVECLPIYAQWLGIDFSGDFLSEEAQRVFVKEAYSLNRIKGTKECLLRVLKIVLDEDVIILENNMIQSYIEKEGISDSLLAGGIYDVNILIRTPLSDNDRHQLLYLLEQFAPIRSRLHLIPLKDTPVLDTESYLDMNAVISGDSVGTLDGDMYISEDVILDE